MGRVCVDMAAVTAGESRARVRSGGALPDITAPLSNIHGSLSNIIGTLPDILGSFLNHHRPFLAGRNCPTFMAAETAGEARARVRRAIAITNSRLPLLILVLTPILIPILIPILKRMPIMLMMMPMLNACQ